MSILPAQYYEQHKWPKWTGTVSALHEYRILRHWHTKEEHVRLSLACAEEALHAELSLHRELQSAGFTYGTGGPLIAGGLRDHWPTPCKNLIRSLNRDLADLRAASLALTRRPRTHCSQ